MAILLTNILLLAITIALYGRYAAIYQEQLREENLINIANLNRSAATNATSLFDSWSVKLNDTGRYIRRHDLTYEQALELLDDANSSEDRQFELIGGDYTGHLARRDEAGAFIPLAYQGISYAEMQEIFDAAGSAASGDARFAPEFTDSYTALKHFAMYIHISLRSGNGERENYTLLLSTAARDVLAVFNTQNVYDGLSSVLLDAKGNYIVSSADFKSDNFFQYLYVYNDLTLDERDGVARAMADTGSGEIYYRDGAGRDCVFRYSLMPENDWYCVTSVPLASFRTPIFSANYAFHATLAILFMLVMDVIWLRKINIRLRISMLREKEAGNAKTEFLSRMSHDIRTPLNGIIGMTLLAMDEPNPPSTSEYLGKIKASGDFLLGLVNDILDMSKVESGKMELRPERYTANDFRKYIEAVIVPLCREKEQEFSLTAPDEDLPVMFDRLRINQIFFNLLSNAVKYTPKGGRIEFSWEITHLSDTRVAIDFVVRDNGIGMSESFQKHMFETFSQEHAGANAIGSGLGLAIVWRLIELMGGRIRVSSKEGEGTTFFVHLETDVCMGERREPPAPERAALEGKRALLCEDNEVNTLIAQRLLGKWGMIVDTAANGRLGVEMFASSAPGDYDVILMDIRMPEMDGLEATQTIRRLDRPDAKAIPIVAMTANAYDTDVRNCLDAGMNAHMGKPIQPDTLREMLIKLVA